MKILAIESSSLVASAAIVEDDITKAEYTLNYKMTHSQTLLPMIDEITKITQENLDTVDAIAVSAGPGSFTGLRIGSATAKGLALALDKPLVAVPTLAAMAYRYYNTDKLICPIMDARRQQVYTAGYTFADGEFKEVLKQQPIAVAELAEMLNTMNQEVIFTGDGIPPYRDVLDEKLTVRHYFAPAHLNRQSAAAVAALAEVYYTDGKLTNAADFAPEYLRVSQAERERAEKNA